MLTRRIIACLDVTAGRVVKGVQFVGLRDAGDPAELAERHVAGGADEIVFLDITATHEGRDTLLHAVQRTAERIFVPLTVGGGIRTLDDATRVFDAGADKISLNSAAITHPDLIEEIGTRFGAQAVVVAIDARRNFDSRRASPDYPAPLTPELADVFIGGGRKITGKRVLDWAREVEQRGAGEILLTSMDADGTRNGFDCALTAAVSLTVQIPVIASGGAGSVDHFVQIFTAGHADAALAASIFHYGVTDARALKQQLAAHAIPMRLPC